MNKKLKKEKKIYLKTFITVTTNNNNNNNLTKNNLKITFNPLASFRILLSFSRYFDSQM